MIRTAYRHADDQRCAAGRAQRRASPRTRPSRSATSATSRASMPISAARARRSRRRWPSRIPVSPPRAGRSRSSPATTRTSPTSAPTSRGNGSTSTGSTSIVDVPTSGVALAVNNGGAARRTSVFLNSGAAASRPDQRAVLAEHRALDLRHLHARQRHRQGGGQGRRRQPGSSSPPITPSATRSSATPRRSSTQNGGKVLGGVEHPLEHLDFSSFLLQAQASKAKVIGLANAGSDTTNSIKQAAEFGIRQGRPEARRTAAVHHRRACARPEDRAGPDAAPRPSTGTSTTTPAPSPSASSRSA